MTPRVQSLRTPDGDLSFTIAHRPRVTRRLHLELDEMGGLRVVVPRDWPDFYTRRLLRKNLAVVRRFLRRAVARPAPLRYAAGENHLFLGQSLELSLEDSATRRLTVAHEGRMLRVSGRKPAPDRVREALRDWYRREARSHFQARLDALQERTPWARGRYLTLDLRRMKRTWGTCRPNGVIRLNTHLVKAPPDIIDYVISHELCHLAEMNHGPRFYRLQAQLWPRWKTHYSHLKDAGARYLRD